MKELFQATHFFLKRNEVHTTEHLSIASLGLWWTFWIIDWFVGRFVFKYSLKAETIDELTRSTIGQIISNTIGIVLAIITINIITDYSKLEPLMHKVKITE